MDHIGYEFKRKWNDAPHSHISSTKIPSYNMIFHAIKGIMARYSNMTGMTDLHKQFLISKSIQWTRPIHTNPRTGKREPLYEDLSRRTSQNLENPFHPHLYYACFSHEIPQFKEEYRPDASSYTFPTEETTTTSNNNGGDIMDMDIDQISSLSSTTTTTTSTANGVVTATELADNVVKCLASIKARLGHKVPASKNVDNLMDKDEFEKLQLHYNDAAIECKLSDADRIKYPYLTKVEINPYFYFFSIPCVIDTIGDWSVDGTRQRNCLHFDGGTTVHKNIERFWIPHDHIGHDILHLMKQKTGLEGSVRSDHRNWRSPSTIAIKKSQPRKKAPVMFLFRIQWMYKSLATHILLGALWKESNGITVPQRILTTVYFFLSKLIDDEEVVFALLEILRKSMPTDVINDSDSHKKINISEEEKEEKKEDYKYKSINETLREMAVDDQVVTDLLDKIEKQDAELMEPNVDGDEDIEMKESTSSSSSANVNSNSNSDVESIEIPPYHNIYGHDLVISKQEEAWLYIAQAMQQNEEEDIYNSASSYSAPNTEDDIKKSSNSNSSTSSNNSNNSNNSGNQKKGKKSGKTKGMVTDASSSYSSSSIPKKLIDDSINSNNNNTDGGDDDNFGDDTDDLLNLTDVDDVITKKKKKNKTSVKKSTKTDKENKKDNKNKNDDIKYDKGKSKDNGSNPNVFKHRKRKRPDMTKADQIVNAKKLIMSEVLPHIAILNKGSSDDEINFKKGVEICKDLAQFMMYTSGICGSTIKDDQATKELETELDLVCVYIRFCMHNHAKWVGQRLKKNCIKGITTNIQALFTDQLVTSTVKSICLSGIARLNKSSPNQTNKATNVSQTRNYKNHLAYLSQSVRNTTQIKAKGREFEARKNHNDVGTTCPTDTPDGLACGVVRHEAQSLEVSLGSDVTWLLSYLNKMVGYKDMKEIDEKSQWNNINQVMKKKFRKMVQYAIKSESTQSNNNNEDNDICDDDDTIKSFADKNIATIEANGAEIGFASIDKAIEMESIVQKLQDANLIDATVSAVYAKSTKTLRIKTFRGRRCMSVINVPLLLKCTLKQILDMSWNDARKAGIIQFIDKEKEKHTTICKDIAHWQELFKQGYIVKYCMIHASDILSLVAALIPFPEHSHSPRNSYATGMLKQAIGIPFINFLTVMHASFNLLFYPQKDTTPTQSLKALQCTDLAISYIQELAFLCWGGWNLEDAHIQLSTPLQLGITKGLRIANTLHTQVKSGSSHNIIMSKNPSYVEGCVGLHLSNYGTSDRDGLPFPGQKLEEDDILIGQTHMDIVWNKDNTKKYIEKCSSVLVQPKNKGIVDLTALTQLDNGDVLIHVRTKEVIDSKIGHKHCSKHAQKVTKSFNMLEENAPYDDEGLSPSDILNPQCLPARMTNSMLFEMVGSTVSLANGIEIDGTVFNQTWKKIAKAQSTSRNSSFWQGTEQNKLIDMDDIIPDDPRSKIDHLSELFTKAGMHSLGSKRYYNGENGELLGGTDQYGQGLVFSGFLTGHKLDHLSEQKMSSRSTGPYNEQTHQATEGKSQNGGHKFGNMEADCLVATGAQAILHCLMLKQADPFIAHPCGTCGTLSTEPNRKAGVYYCRVCQSDETSYQTETAYTFSSYMLYMTMANFLPRVQLSKPFIKTITQSEIDDRSMVI